MINQVKGLTNRDVVKVLEIDNPLLLNHLKIKDWSRKQEKSKQIERDMD